MQNKTVAIYFSPAGTTEKIAIHTAQNLGGTIEKYDLCEQSETFYLSGDDIAVVSVPVFGGRVPELAAKAIRQISGNQVKTVAIVVYGNRHYDDALLELCDLLLQQDFQIAAAGAFVARHSVVGTVAEGRPNERDLEGISAFAAEAKEKITAGSTIPIDEIPGSRPYKKGTSLKIPIITSDTCTNCGLCAEKCLGKAIPEENGRETDSNKCIACMRCIHICPVHARAIPDPPFETFSSFLSQFNTPRKNECYF